MDKLLKIIHENNASIHPASKKEIEELKKELGIKFSMDYEKYLLSCGSIAFNTLETYGFDIKTGTTEKLVDLYNELLEDSEYPNSAVPLLKFEEDHYYLYDNWSDMVLEWLGDDGGVASTVNENLEEFFVKYIFDQ